MVDKYSSRVDDEKQSLRLFPLIKHLMIRRNITLRHKDVRQGKYFDHYEIDAFHILERFINFHRLRLFP